MTDEPIQTDAQRQIEQFEQQANQAQIGTVAEFVDFFLHNKKWWLTPIILVLLIVGLPLYVAGRALPASTRLRLGLRCR